MDRGTAIGYRNKFRGNGVNFFVPEGAIEAAGAVIGKRDAIGVYKTDEVSINARETAEVPAIEVPMITA
jgi:hypothetical protein